MANNRKIKKGAKKMMNNASINKNIVNTINIAEIEGDGAFACPECGTLISPDDETEEIYKIVETKIVNDQLTALVISCGTCGTKTNVIGFQQMVNEIPSERQ